MPNQCWSLAFLSGTFRACSNCRILAVNDDGCSCLIADTSISGARQTHKLEVLVQTYGKPACIVSDNCTVFISRAILKWAEQNDVE